MIANIQMNVYEFVLQNYSTEISIGDKEYHTINLKKSDVSSCGKITSTDRDEIITEQNEIIRSCDPIHGTLSKIYAHPIFDFNDTDTFEIRPSTRFPAIKSNSLLRFINIFGAKKNNLRSDFLEKKKYIDPDLSQIYTNDFFQNIKEKINVAYSSEYTPSPYSTFIQSITPSESDKIIIFGDFHGSFSSLVRHFMRLRVKNIIDKDFRIVPNYKIVFLGDVVDRGGYSYECIILLWALKACNPDGVFIIRGNHEEIEMNGQIKPDSVPKTEYTLKEELEIKFESKFVPDIFRTINEIMLRQPSGVIISSPGFIRDKIFLCHGGLPHSNADSNRIDDTFLLGITSNGTFPVDDRSVGRSIRWNDFYGKNATIENVIRGDGTKIIGQNVLESAKNIGIKLIIRGHQDSIDNTSIIQVGDDAPKSLKNSINTPGNKIQCTNHIYNISICPHTNKLKINNNQKEYLPVITTSTNTDLGRNLTGDSYIELFFSPTMNFPDCSEPLPPSRLAATSRPPPLSSSLVATSHDVTSLVATSRPPPLSSSLVATSHAVTRPDTASRPPPVVASRPPPVVASRPPPVVASRPSSGPSTRYDEDSEMLRFIEEDRQRRLKERSIVASRPLSGPSTRYDEDSEMLRFIEEDRQRRLKGRLRSPHKGGNKQDLDYIYRYKKYINKNNYI
jgi:hypothetical protein